MDSRITHKAFKEWAERHNWILVNTVGQDSGEGESWEIEYWLTPIGNTIKINVWEDNTSTLEMA